MNLIGVVGILIVFHFNIDPQKLSQDGDFTLRKVETFDFLLSTLVYVYPFLAPSSCQEYVEENCTLVQPKTKYDF